MFDSTNLLVNKLILRIRRGEHSECRETVFDTVKHILHQQINESFSLYFYGSVLYVKQESFS